MNPLIGLAMVAVMSAARSARLQEEHPLGEDLFEIYDPSLDFVEPSLPELRQELRQERSRYQEPPRSQKTRVALVRPVEPPQIHKQTREIKRRLLQEAKLAAKRGEAK